MSSVSTDLDFSFEQENKRKGHIAAIIFFVICGLALFIPFRYQNPPPGQEGILVNLGVIDAGGGNPTVEKESSPEPTPPTEAAKPVEQPKKPEVKKTVKPQPQPAKKVIVSNTEDKSLEVKKQEEKIRKQKAEAAAKAAAARAEAERIKAQQEQIRKQKAAADKAAADLFNNLDGDPGEGTKPGEQGDPNGGKSPIKTGKSFGGGTVGEGLENRGGAGPQISASFQKTGTVVIQVCVNSQGVVTSTDYTLSGSTSSDPQLIALATKNARQWNFNTKTGVTSQCGKIFYNFSLK